LSVHAVRWQPRVKTLVAVSCMAVAALWIVERAKPLVSMMS
jgi:hypothetical protein